MKKDVDECNLNDNVRRPRKAGDCIARGECFITPACLESMKLEVDTSNGGLIVRRPQQDGLGRKVAGKLSFVLYN